MFGFLKKKIKETSEKIAEEIEQESSIVSEEEITEEEKQELMQEEEEVKKGFFKKLFSKKEKQVEEIKSIEEELAEEQENISEEVVEEKIEEKPEVVEKEIPEEEPKEIIEPEVIKEEPQEVEETIEEKETPIPEIKEEIIEKPIQEKPKEKKIFGIFKKKEKKKDILKEELPAPEEPHLEEQKQDIIEEKPEEIIEKPAEEKETPLYDPTRKKKNILAKLSEKIKKLNITDEKFEELFWDLEVALLENNVAVEVIEKIKSNLKEELENTKITKKTINDLILNNLRNTIESLFNYEEFNLIQKIKDKNQQGEPYKILFLGINGSGKTTTLAKLVKYFKDNNMTSVIAAADTFRAAAIQQLEEHANNLNIKIIKHDYGADPAAVAFDAIEHAKSKKAEVVLIDTAGRLHSNSNLIDELKKIVRVSKPDLNIFVGESITGNDCVEQATNFNDSIGIDGIILTKADIDEKGGAAISISYVTDKPILFITTGQEYKDLKKFTPKEIIDSIFND